MHLKYGKYSVCLPVVFQEHGFINPRISIQQLPLPHTQNQEQANRVATPQAIQIEYDPEEARRSRFAVDVDTWTHACLAPFIAGVLGQKKRAGFPSTRILTTCDVFPMSKVIAKCWPKILRLGLGCLGSGCLNKYRP